MDWKEIIDIGSIPATGLIVIIILKVWPTIDKVIDFLIGGFKKKPVSSEKVKPETAIIPNGGNGKSHYVTQSNCHEAMDGLREFISQRDDGLHKKMNETREDVKELTGYIKGRLDK